jgi:hypothetical protein
VKGGFVFATGGNLEQVIGVLEIQFGVNMRLSRCIEEIHNQRKQIIILPRGVAQPTAANTKPETSILLLSEEHRSTMGGTRWINEIRLQLPAEELLKCQKFSWRKGTDGTDRRFCTIDGLDLKIEFKMR